MDLVVIEKHAYLQLKLQIESLSAQIESVKKKIGPVEMEKWLDAQEVCLALNISKRSLQGYREYGIIPYSCIGGKYMYKESDLAKILIQKER